ncbi:MAG: hypothetical protein K6T31_09500 [Alicyclobacillus sp.]|nr:hypothetical protein [Alicyclobacillus sp.]
MKRPWEAGLMVALAVLTAMTTASLLRGAEAPERKLDGWLRQGWSWLVQHTGANAGPGVDPAWLKPASVPAAAQTSLGPAPDSAPVSLKMQEPTVSPVPSAGSPWTADDLAHAQAIAGELAAGFTPTFASQLLGWLSAGDTAQAEQMLQQWLQVHLTAADKQWITQRFQGDAAFRADDVSLLVHALQQEMQLLTPEENALLSQWVSRPVADTEVGTGH